MMQPLQIVLACDVFPPRTGGAGWSSHALARALQARGHHVTAFVPQRGQRGISKREAAGVPVIDIGYTAPAIPFLANYARFEAFWPRFAAHISAFVGQLPRERVIIHGQHLQGIGAAVLAGERLNVPVVATVRDHWPWHYFGTGLHSDHVPLERFGVAAAATDLIGRNSPLPATVSLAGVPYMQKHMQRRRALLKRCDGVIGVSSYITHRLRGIVDAARLHTVPNMVDLHVIDQIISEPLTLDVPQDFVLFAGKLARNKGAYLLPAVMQAFREHGGTTALVIVGGEDSALIQQIKETGTHVTAFEWAAHDDVLRLMSRCQALVFPSTWGEPLSRVLLEASAVGAPIVAIPTGGTADILKHQQTALFAHSASELGYQLARLVNERHTAEWLGRQARAQAAQQLHADHLSQVMEQLYCSLSDYHQQPE